MSAKLVLAAAAISAFALAQVPLDQEPRHHIEFSNEMLRIISPKIPAGDTTLDHLHTHDDATVCIHGSEVRAKSPTTDWSNPASPCMPGRVGFTEYTGKPRSHTVQNTGSGLYHLLLVENRRDGDWKTNPAVTVEGLKMTRENRAFRAYEADATVAAHVHEVPTVVVLVSGTATAGGKQLDQPGQWAYIAAGEKHQVTGSGQIIEIEVR
jgi:hypothetical protein